MWLVTHLIRKQRWTPLGKFTEVLFHFWEWACGCLWFIAVVFWAKSLKSRSSQSCPYDRITWGSFVQYGLRGWPQEVFIYCVNLGRFWVPVCLKTHRLIWLQANFCICLLQTPPWQIQALLCLTVLQFLLFTDAVFFTNWRFLVVLCQASVLVTYFQQH